MGENIYNQKANAQPPDALAGSDDDPLGRMIQKAPAEMDAAVS